MVSNGKDVWQDIIASLIYLGWAFFVLYVIPFYAILGPGRGAESDFFKDLFTFYTGLGAFALLILLLFKWFRFFAGKSNTLGWVDSRLHDPEDTPLWQFKTFRIISRRIDLMLLLSFFLLGGFSILGGLLKSKNFPNTGLVQVEQQIAKGSELVLSVYPASPAETLFLAVIISLILMAVYRTCQKGFDGVTITLLSLLGIYTIGQALLARAGVVVLALSVVLPAILMTVLILLAATVFRGDKRNNFALWMVLLLIVPVMSGAHWLGFHEFRYGDSEQAKTAVFGFGYVSGFAMVSTGMVLPALVYHDSNNFVQKAIELFASDTALLILGVIWLGSGVLFIVLFVRAWHSAKGKSAPALGVAG